MHQESKQKKRLSQHNEELQWKLKQNSEVVNALVTDLCRYFILLGLQSYLNSVIFLMSLELSNLLRVFVTEVKKK